MNLIELQMFTWPTWYTWVTIGFIGLIIFSVAPIRIFLTIGLVSILTGVLISLKILNDNYDSFIFFVLTFFIFHYIMVTLIVKK
ncbi:MAG: hypothetical protein CML56_01960 [Rhodobacteraceae bacterium]|nr:hypothetical protein [Paracoccaceae bacterium]